jgi:hypothetical protein
MNLDTLQWNPVARIEKYDNEAVQWVRDSLGVERPTGDQLSLLASPWEVLTVPGNALTTAGLDRIGNLIIGATANGMDSTRVRLGVGDDSTAYAAGDSDLSTGANQYYRVMDATYPQQSNGVLTFKASFATGEANFAWQCWGLDIGTATVTSSGTVSAILVNRKVASLGTKASGTWVLTVTVTFS